MKKIITLLVVLGMFSFQSCSTSDPDYIDTDTIGTVFETNYVSFLPNDYIVRYTFPYSLYQSDVVLVYRLAGNVNGNDLWEFLPETYYFDDGTRDFSYNFNFTRSFVDIYLNGNDLASVPAGNRLNQIFRIVVVPAAFASTVNSDNYLEVINALNLKESEVKKIDF
ncbi:MAG: hypothetical protein V4572_04675 [Bacteroidota bacterium]